MANNENALAEAIRPLDQNLNQNRVEHPIPAGNVFTKLAQIKPPYYNGGQDPSLLEGWMREFDKIFYS